MRRRIHCGLAILLIIVLGGFILVGADTSVEEVQHSGGTAQRVVDAMQEIGRILLEATEPLQEALGFAAMGLNADNPDDERLYAQALINILEGSASEAYDSEVGVTVSYSLGLRPLLGQLSYVDEDWATLDSLSYASGADARWNRFLSLLRLASETMQDGLNFEVDATDIEDAFLSAYALLIFVHDGVQEMLRMWGFEIWIAPGESIQAAIDQAWSGATIYIEPGIYRESLHIDKDLTLMKSPFTGPPELSQYDPETFSVTLEPVASQAGITIGSSDPIQVDIHLITIRNASTALRIGGSARVSAEWLWIQDCVTGIEVSDVANLSLASSNLEYFDSFVVSASDSAFLEISSCYLERANTGVRLLDEAALSMTDCKIGLNEIDLDLQGGHTSLVDCRIWDPILVSGEASLEMTDTSIYGSDGSGIIASDQAQLSLTGGYITHCSGDGVLLTGVSTLDMRGVYCAENGGYGVRALSEDCALDEDHQLEIFSGAITGADNIVPGQGDYMGNSLGGVCPESLHFLTNSVE